MILAVFLCSASLNEGSDWNGNEMKKAIDAVLQQVGSYESEDDIIPPFAHFHFLSSEEITKNIINSISSESLLDFEVLIFSVRCGHHLERKIWLSVG
jgi:hypothetical protein